MLTHNHVACATEGCFGVITLHPQEEQRLRESHETFYCPAKHSNYFPGKTEQEKLIDSLRRDLRVAERFEHEVIQDRHRAEEQRDRAVDVLRCCPVCGVTPGRAVVVHRDWRYEDDLASLRAWMHDHLERVHEVSPLQALVVES